MLQDGSNERREQEKYKFTNFKKWETNIRTIVKIFENNLASKAIHGAV
jgi:hypothetical protein